MNRDPVSIQSAVFVVDSLHWKKKKMPAALRTDHFFLAMFIFEEDSLEIVIKQVLLKAALKEVESEWLYTSLDTAF